MTAETKIAKALIKAALKRGYLISVNDGEEWAIQKSMDASAVWDAMRSTDADTLVFFADSKDAGYVRLGFALLIWGNGEDIISDYSAKVKIDELVEEANAAA